MRDSAPSGTLTDAVDWSRVRPFDCECLGLAALEELLSRRIASDPKPVVRRSGGDAWRCFGIGLCLQPALDPDVLALIERVRHRIRVRLSTPEGVVRYGVSVIQWSAYAHCSFLVAPREGGAAVDAAIRCAESSTLTVDSGRIARAFSLR